MKKIFIIAAAVMCAAVPVNAAAVDLAENDYRYACTENDDGTYTIISAKLPPGETAEAVPLQLGGKAVSAVGAGAYKGNLELETLLIHENIKSIGEGAFMSCTSLKNVYVAPGITEIPADCFFACAKLEQLILPNTLTTIGREAFHGCTLLDIYIPPSVTNIGADAVGKTAESHGTANTAVYGFLIKGKKGSTAELYAAVNGIDFIDMDDYTEGDVNGDGLVDATDATDVLIEYSRASTGAQPVFTRKQKIVGDMNYDGMTDATDASAILSKYAQLSTS